MGKKIRGSGSGMNNPDHISESLEILKFFADSGSGINEKNTPGILEGNNSNPGSGVNIPDPQHWEQ
jgi:hypothetical protein